MRRTQRTEQRQHTVECLSYNLAVLESIFCTYGVLFGPLTPTPGEAHCRCAAPLEPTTAS